jgi:hypothetical protein
MRTSPHTCKGSHKSLQTRSAGQCCCLKAPATPTSAKNTKYYTKYYTKHYTKHYTKYYTKATAEHP